MSKIPFNRAHITEDAITYLSECLASKHLAGDGYFSKMCSSWIEEQTSSHKALLTHSCTAALEMTAILTNIKAGDEVIMPSYTFSSTANAFVLRGATPVFVDICADTLNIDGELIEAAITPRTKVIVVVHYAGVACDMDAIMSIAAKYGLIVVEDAAQAVLSKYKGRALGSVGDLGCYSFHATKNIISGEGGALLLNKTDHELRSEIIWEKGTNRTQFLRGDIDKYSWVDMGSSYLPSEIIAALLWSQFNHAHDIIKKRVAIWEQYHDEFVELEQLGFVSRPHVPKYAEHNAHMYYFIFNQKSQRDSYIQFMRQHGIECYSHYEPLHTSAFGMRIGRSVGCMQNTVKLSASLVRLPLWLGVENCLDEIVSLTYRFFGCRV